MQATWNPSHAYPTHVVYPNDNTPVISADFKVTITSICEQAFINDPGFPREILHFLDSPNGTTLLEVKPMRDSISDQDPSDGSFFCGERIYTLETLTYERLNAELK